jgi:two-component system sensor histidine kinase KdpD
MKDGFPTDSLPTWARFGLGLGAVAVTTAVLLIVRPWLSSPVVALLFLLPVMLAATRCGLQPALVSSLAAFFTFNYFFLVPRHTLVVQNPDEFLVLLVFLIVAVLISQLVSTANAHAAQAQARERETATLYKLSHALNAQANLDEVLASVTRQVAEMFDLAACEVLLSAPDASLQSHARYQAAGSLPQGQVVDLALTAHQASVGVLRLTALTANSDIDPVARRVLTTFAAQVGLVVERARLAREAARAHLLEESDRLKSALLSSVSHDLRTPLSAIKASATVLLQRDVSLDAAARNDLLLTIDEETDRLNRLVTNLLDMSRIEAGALTLKLDWCDLDELIRAVLRRLSFAAAALTIQLDWLPDLPLIYADYVQLDRVVTNLVENAIHFAPAGSTIQVRAYSDSAGVTVSVSNQGPPIPETARPHLFDKFYRIYQDRTPDMGTGLGLSICKGIVEAHGGRIWVESPVAGGSGARFVFTLPFPPGKEPMPFPNGVPFPNGTPPTTGEVWDGQEDQDSDR